MSNLGVLAAALFLYSVLLTCFCNHTEADLVFVHSTVATSMPRIGS